MNVNISLSVTSTHVIGTLDILRLKINPEIMNSKAFYGTWWMGTAPSTKICSLDLWVRSKQPQLFLTSNWSCRINVLVFISRVAKILVFLSKMLSVGSIYECRASLSRMNVEGSTPPALTAASTHQQVPALSDSCFLLSISMNEMYFSI